MQSLSGGNPGVCILQNLKPLASQTKLSVSVLQ